MPDQPRKAAVIATTAAATVLTLIVLGYLSVVAGLLPANADAKPGSLERWVAKRSLHAAIARDSRGQVDPLAADDSTLTRGVRLYGTHCAVCHGTSDEKPSSVAKGLYQKPPQFAKDDVTDDPVEMTYWKITHGIRLTGMPSYATTLTDDQRWAIATFLRHQTELTPRANEAWKALPSADTRAEE
jgi:mono/diheme cytochrome c family protein